MPSNLRRDPECLHLVTVVTSGHMIKMAVNTIRSTVPENPMLHANSTTLMFDRTRVIADLSFKLLEWVFSILLAPVTLTLTR